MTKRSRSTAVLLRWHELPLLLGLILMWMALWREISWMTLTSGLVVSVLAMRLFYLPPIELAGRLNVWWTLRYIGYFIYHLAAASVHVGWLAVRPGPKPRTAIVAVQLRTRSDFILTMVGATVSLIPGSLVTDVDRLESTLYLHVLDTPTPESVEAFRKETWRIEALLIRAVGSKEEIGLLS